MDKTVSKTESKPVAKSPELLRIHHYLAQCGIDSRRNTEDLIRDGSVTINGVTATIGQNVTGKEDIRIGKKRVLPEQKIYIAFNKPKGVLSTTINERGLPCALDYIKLPQRLFIAGRLDLDAEGLLILTNDGDWAQKVAHPKHATGKTYIVQVDIPLEKVPRRLNIDYQRTYIESKMRTPYTWEITIHEGRKHIVKNIFAKIGRTVQKLERVRIGNITLGNMIKGEWRHLKKEEVASI